MATNVEIKARVVDWPAVNRRAEAISDAPREVIEQEDVFFHTRSGRLKLRFLAPDRGELIFYERPDSAGPKASRYEIATTSDPHSLRRVLAAALGERGAVRKTRWLYLVDRTRIHLDRVEGLGDFMELEVVMEPGEPAAEGDRIANDLMSRLGISPSDLIEGAYIDLLEGPHAAA